MTTPILLIYVAVLVYVVCGCKSRTYARFVSSSFSKLCIKYAYVLRYTRDAEISRASRKPSAADGGGGGPVPVGVQRPSFLPGEVGGFSLCRRTATKIICIDFGDVFYVILLTPEKKRPSLPNSRCRSLKNAVHKQETRRVQISAALLFFIKKN